MTVMTFFFSLTTVSTSDDWHSISVFLAMQLGSSLGDDEQYPIELKHLPEISGTDLELARFVVHYPLDRYKSTATA